MKSPDRFYRICAIAMMVSAAPLIACGGDLNENQDSRSAHCSAFLPAEAAPADSLQLCRSEHTGKDELYACQRFAGRDEHYRVFFKGGRHPKAIAAITVNGAVKEMLWTDADQANRPVCDFPPPMPIPASAKFTGAGVCLDNADQFIPCAVFRYKASRLQTVSDHMVFYDAGGAGPAHIATTATWVNRNAMPAELAYQIGLSLLKTDCCQQQGLEYIRRASEIFPDSTLYRTAYLQFSKLLSSGAQPFPPSSGLEQESAQGTYADEN